MTDMSATAAALADAGPSSRPAPAGRPYGGQRAEDRVAERRARLVEAGIESFGTRGYHGTTVRGVCAAAGLTDRYFYESFDSLEALLGAVYRTLMERLRERLLRAQRRAAAHGPRRQAAAGFGAWFDAVRDTRFARIVLHEVLGVSREIDALYEDCTREFAELTAAPLQAALGASAGAASSGQQRALVGRALVGAAIQVAAMWVNGGYRMPRRAVVRTCVLVAVGTLRALQDEASQQALRGEAAQRAPSPPAARRPKRHSQES